MVLTKFLILFFGLPAAESMAFRQPADHSLMLHIIVPHYIRSCRPYIKCLVVLCCMFSIMQTTNAQVDSNYVDTIDVTAIDTVAVSSGDETSPGYDDQDDGYVDTAGKHIYDTSQYFFNWKDFNDDPFAKEKITQRSLIDKEVNALKQQDEFWYVPAIEKLEMRLRNDPKFRDSLMNARNRELIDEQQNGLLYQPWFNTLVWILIIGIFAGAVIYFLVQNKINIFSKDAAASFDESGEDDHDDIFSLSYIKLIQNAEKEKDHRLAVRLMFLQTLKLLSDTNAIQYQPDYTDLHYLQQLNQSKYYNDFFNVMRSYEYVWYGKFAISPEKYVSIKNEFLKLQHKII